MEKVLQPVKILDNATSPRFLGDDEIRASLPPFGKQILWRFAGKVKDGKSNYMEGKLIDGDENGYMVMDHLDVEGYDLHEFSHWLREVSIAELMNETIIS